jgi:hypothetical protein
MSGNADEIKLQIWNPQRFQSQAIYVTHLCLVPALLGKHPGPK